MIIDTYENQKLLNLAIDMVSRCTNIGEIYVFSDKDLRGVNNIRINKIRSISEYNNLTLVSLPEYVTQDFVLVFQWDGFPLDNDSWSDDFLKYDYIGAPHYSEVYKGPFFNGGFSLRSKKLLEKVRSTVDSYPGFVNFPEDAVICSLLREKLEKFGVIFPDVDIASQFSYELGVMPKRFFGFHGAFNFPLFFKEIDLIDMSEELVERVNQPHILNHLLQSSYQKNYFHFIEVCLEKIDRWHSLKLVSDYIMASSLNAGMRDLFKSRLMKK